VGSNQLCGMNVCFHCMFSGRDLCNELITHPEKFNRLLCVTVCDLETSRMSWPWPMLGHNAAGKEIYVIITVMSESDCSQCN